MKIIHCHGIDVSKDTLDASLSQGKPVRVPHTLEGANELKERLPDGAVVYLEATRRKIAGDLHSV